MNNKDASLIPYGEYCMSWLPHSQTNGGYLPQNVPCPYFSYIHIYDEEFDEEYEEGYCDYLEQDNDILLDDMCKICGINRPVENIEHDKEHGLSEMKEKIYSPCGCIFSKYDFEDKFTAVRHCSAAEEIWDKLGNAQDNKDWMLADKLAAEYEKHIDGGKNEHV